MPGRAIASALALLLYVAAAALAQEATPRPGLYDVSVHLELPHINDTNTTKTEQLCLSSVAEPAAFGLKVLSGNNPLLACPASNIQLIGAALTFDIACGGSNLSRGSAACQLGGETFQCRIDMKMGGKNMTMTEVQNGRRIGDCAN